MKVLSQAAVVIGSDFCLDTFCKAIHAFLFQSDRSFHTHTLLDIAYVQLCAYMCTAKCVNVQRRVRVTSHVMFYVVDSIWLVNGGYDRLAQFEPDMF